MPRLSQADAALALRGLELLSRQIESAEEIHAIHRVCKRLSARLAQSEANRVTGPDSKPAKIARSPV
jgi:hypothetical protein